MLGVLGLGAEKSMKSSQALKVRINKRLRKHFAAPSKAVLAMKLWDSLM